MLETIKTERLTLEPAIDDYVSFNAELLADRRVTRFIRRPKGRFAERLTAQKRIASNGENGCGWWAVRRRSDNAKLGFIILMPIPGAEPHIEIGYRFSPFAWGNGYATEAARAIRDYAFITVGLDELHAVIDVRNRGSRKVLRRIGLNQTGMIRAYGLWLPKLHLTRCRWKALIATK